MTSSVAVTKICFFFLLFFFLSFQLCVCCQAVDYEVSLRTSQTQLSVLAPLTLNNAIKATRSWKLDKSTKVQMKQHVQPLILDKYKEIKQIIQDKSNTVAAAKCRKVQLAKKKKNSV